MSLAKFSSDFLMETFTLVDNLFINEHLPYLDEKQIKIYIYGLYLCSAAHKDNTLEGLAAALGVETNDVLNAYTYFEEAGLCRVISREPLTVQYLSLKRAMQPPKKYKSEKWNDFNTELQNLFPERMLMPNELNEYYAFFDLYKLEQSAMLMIVKYCIDLKGDSVRYPYILAVAKNWVNDGVKSVADVEEKLTEFDKQSDDMRTVLYALGRKNGAEPEEKQMLLKWTRSWGYELPAVTAAVDTLKGGKTFKKLDARLDEFYRMSIFTAEEIADYRNQRDKLTDLTVKILKNLGLYYESLEHIIEYYTVPWTSKGFESDALIALSHHCFISGIRTLDGLNAVVNSFFDKGLLTLDSINEYISAELKQDERIKNIIGACGRSRAVTASDRGFYRTWTTVWGFDDDVILFAAAEASGKTYPTTYVNRLLSDWKKQGITTVEEAKRQPVLNAAASSAKTAAKPNFDEREYTKDELKSVISTIDTLKNLNYNDL